MRVGDLVRYTRTSYEEDQWWDWTGIIIDQTLGSAGYQIVRWFQRGGIETSTPKKHLTVLSKNNS